MDMSEIFRCSVVNLRGMKLSSQLTIQLSFLDSLKLSSVASKSSFPDGLDERTQITTIAVIAVHLR